MIEINNLMSSKTIVFTGNEIIDIILNNKKFIAEKENIIVDFHINVTDKTLFTLYGSQLGIILSNLLDNAVNAAKLSEEKTISLKISNRREHIKITICNSVSPKNRPDLFSPPTPHGKHGFGILSVKNIVKKLEGSISFKFTDKDFIVNVFI
jgi:sensor histidine kinase regulating citrate/malate metabolism